MNSFDNFLTDGFFARHETFCPRYGWLKKGFDEVSKDGDIFDRDDAIERLGVGKNMVRSIRFWCMAFHLIEPDVESGPRRLAGPMRTTDFGKALLSDEGWDPFLEDPASLWLLHWQLFSPPIAATTWSLAINLGHFGSITLKELDQALKDRKSSYPKLDRYSDSSVYKDASCFIRMYAASTSQRGSDEIECPFTDLGLLVPTDERQTFRFNGSDKSTLAEEIFFAACCDYAYRSSPAYKPDFAVGSKPLPSNKKPDESSDSDREKGSRSLSLNKATYGFNAPGVVFKLSESSVGYRLERVAQKLPKDVSFVELYGSRQLQFEQDPLEIFWRVLDQYYSQNNGARR